MFDSSKYPPLAAITALHNLGISLFKHWLIYYSKPPEGLPKDDSHWLDTSYGHHRPVSSSIGLRSGDWEAIPWQTWCQLTVSSPNRICTAWKCAWKCDIVQNTTFLGRFQTFGGQCISTKKFIQQKKKKKDFQISKHSWIKMHLLKKLNDFKVVSFVFWMNEWMTKQTLNICQCGHNYREKNILWQTFFSNKTHLILIYFSR